MKDNIIEVDIEDHFGGEYRLYYDGKYLGLMGTDKNYPGFNYNPNDPIWYEEMVLIPVIIEIRNANPRIKEIIDKKIIISLNVK